MADDASESYVVPPPKIGRQTAILDLRRFGGEEYRFYRVPDLDRLLDDIDAQEFARDERMPYWAELWPSGGALAGFLAACRSLRGLRVLELGCGLGLPSIVAARKGAYVTASDYMPDAFDLLAVNARLNGVTVKTVELDWRSPSHVGRFDLVIAADVLYEQWHNERIVEVLGRTVSPAGGAILVDPERVAARTFMNRAVARGFMVVRRACADGESAIPLVLYELSWRR